MASTGMTIFHHMSPLLTLDEPADAEEVDAR